MKSSYLQHSYANNSIAKRDNYKKYEKLHLLVTVQHYLHEVKQNKTQDHCWFSYQPASQISSVIY